MTSGNTRESTREARQMYYGLLSIGFLVACIAFWMRGYRLPSNLSVAGSAIASFMAVRPNYGQELAAIVAVIMVVVGVALTILASTFVGTNTGTFECKGCADVFDKSELAKHQLCPACGNETRNISHLSKKGWERSKMLA